MILKINLPPLYYIDACKALGSNISQRNWKILLEENNLKQPQIEEMINKLSKKYVNN